MWLKIYLDVGLFILSAIIWINDPDYLCEYSIACFRTSYFFYGQVAASSPNLNKSLIDFFFFSKKL